MSDTSQILTPEQKIEKEVKDKTGLDFSIKQLDVLTEAQYKSIYKNLYKECMESGISKKNVLRGIFKALDIGIDSGLAPTLNEETEAKIGGYFAQLLDKRNLILAKHMREEEAAILEDALRKQEEELNNLNTESINDKGEQ